MKRRRVARLAKADREHYKRRIAARDYPRLLNRVLKHLFRISSHRAEAIRILQQYGSSSTEPECDRVRLAILKLAGADLTQIQAAVIAAKEDYEDTLSWAEAPWETKLLMANHKVPSARKLQIAAQDRQQCDNWLEAHGA